MVHCQHRIGMVKILRLKKGVGRQRPAEVHALFPHFFQYGNKRIDLFRAHMAAFARVGVQAADQDVRFGKAELVLQIIVQNGNHFSQQIRRNGIADRLQRQVRCRQRHAQFFRCQHHHHFCRARTFFKEFGMPGKWNAGVVNNAFVHRPGDQCGKFTAQTAVAGARQRLNDVAPVLHV